MYYKKISITLIFSVLFFVNLLAENYNNKLTFDTYIFLKMHENKSITNNKSKSKDYFLQSKNGMEYTKLYLKVNENYSIEKLENLGCKELVKTKSVALLSVPIEQIEQLSAFDFIELIEIAKQPKLMLDKALPATNVDKVHQGLDLEQSYFGEGVIVGILDIGFDFTHPMFSDENGNCRVKRAWVVDGVHNSNPPAGFETGILYTDSSIIKNEVKSGNKFDFHGSHTLGIAAGTPVQGTQNKYSGIATKSDIAVVEFGDWGDEPPDDFDINVMHLFQITSLEGFSYLFKYADSMNKPIVINYSAGWYGFQYDPDGQGIMDIAISELLNEHPQGKILVASAGNAGGVEEEDFSHFEIDNTSTDSAVFVLREHYVNGMYFCGEENKNYTIELQFKNGDDNEIYKLITLSTTKPVALLDTTITIGIFQPAYKEYSYWLLGSIKPPSTTNRSAIELMLFRPDHFSWELKDTITIIVRGNNQIIHTWRENGGLILKTDNITANGNYTMGSPAMLDEVIGVGAYKSKNYGPYVEDDGEVGDIACFSSQGPLLNKKIKPDITAPGHTLFAAMNSFCGDDVDYYDEKIQFSNYGVVACSGTSMSSPMVAGIVALMLEKKPNLTQAEAKEIIRITAINDDFTGDVRDNKSPVWGWGKINAHAIMKYLEKVSIDENLNMDLYVFPNPTTDFINVIFDNPSASNVKIDILNSLGQIISTPIDKYCESGIQAITINDLKLPVGVYFVRMNTNKTSQVKTFIVK